MKPEDILGKVPIPDPVKKIPGATPGEQIGSVLSNIIILIYTIAGIVFVFMILFSAWQMLTSGGDKEKVAGARQRLTFAIIGIVLLSLAFVIIQYIGEITGFEFIVGQIKR